MGKLKKDIDKELSCYGSTLLALQASGLNSVEETHNLKVESVDQILSLIRQHKIGEQIEEAEYVARLIDRGWIPPEEARLKPPEDKVKAVTEISTILLEFAEWYREYRPHPIHEVPFNIAYLEGERKSVKIAAKICQLFPQRVK